MILGLLISLISFALQSFAMFGRFHTFLGPGVDGAKLRLMTISAQLRLKLGLSLANTFMYMQKNCGYSRNRKKYQ